MSSRPMRSRPAMTLIVVGLLSAQVALAHAGQVRDYQLYLALCRPSAGGDDLVGLRRLLIDGEAHHLVVDPVTLHTALIPASRLKVERRSFLELRSAFVSTPYMKAIAQAEIRKKPLQDAGIVHSLPVEQGVVLTVDLCPSPRPLDRSLFRQVIDGFKEVERPVPVAISITGTWLSKHPTDLRWLRERVDAGELSVTWINHSYHHAFDPRRPLGRNFLLTPGINVDAEVLRAEEAMIEHGLLPSVFFRFPGLVSDESAFDRVILKGLIPTGSDAWLAKGETPTPGSIVLIHGNGNEPKGVRAFLELMRRERSQIKRHDWLLFDLRSISRE